MKKLIYYIALWLTRPLVMLALGAFFFAMLMKGLDDAVQDLKPKAPRPKPNSIKVEHARQTLEEIWYAMNDMLPTDSMDNFDYVFEKVRKTIIDLGGFTK